MAHAEVIRWISAVADKVLQFNCLVSISTLYPSVLAIHRSVLPIHLSAHSSVLPTHLSVLPIILPIIYCQGLRLDDQPVCHARRCNRWPKIAECGAAFAPLPNPSASAAAIERPASFRPDMALS